MKEKLTVARDEYNKFYTGCSVSTAEAILEARGISKFNIWCVDRWSDRKSVTIEYSSY